MTCVRCRHENTKKCGFSGRRKLQRYNCQNCHSTFVDPTAEKSLDGHYVDLDTSARALELMMEGMSVRAISRLTGLHIGTILSLMNSAGEKCRRLLDSKIRNVRPAFVQADELHSYVGTRGKNMRRTSPKDHGDRWLWLAMDSDTKLILSHLVEKRTLDAAHMFIGDLSTRTQGTFQLSTDALKAYRDAIDAYYATNIHYGTVIKMFGSPDVSGPDWYSTTNKVIGVVQRVRCGRPDKKRISTSHVERLNLSVRMHLKRFARATNAHSRKLENHKAVVCLFVAWFNFCRVNTTIRVTPCMAAGITSTIWTMRDLLGTSI